MSDDCIVHSHAPTLLNLECEGCQKAHHPHGRDLVFIDGDSTWEMTQTEWFREFWYPFTEAAGREGERT